MNKAEKQVARAVLDAEKKQLRELKAVFNQARKDTQEKIIQLSARIAVEPQNLQTIIYQIKYQQMIQQQLDNALHDLQKQTYDSVDQYLHECYNNGYVGTMYSISAQGIPLTVPIDQKRVADALKIDSKISEGLYTRMGEDVKRLKNSIRAEVSRGIANGESWYQLAQHIAKGMNSPFDAALSRTMTIARTEGHRVQENATMDAAKAARDKGANQLKQWDSALDERVRPAHREADGQLRELDEPFNVMGEEIQKPGEGSAANCINCRCHMLLRARWELDEVELDILKERAKVHEVYGIQNQSYKEYKDKYLKLPANADKIKVSTTLNQPVAGKDEVYKELVKRFKGAGVEYKPVESHIKKLTTDEIIKALAGGDKTQGSCASLGLAYMGQVKGWNVLDFRDGISRRQFSHSINLLNVSKMKGMSAVRYGDVAGKSSCTLANNFLKTCEAGKEYLLSVGRHVAVVRKTNEGKLQYLELQSPTKSGWTDFNGNPRYTLTHRFGCYSASGHGEIYDFMLNITDSDFDADEFKSLLGYLNTAEDKQVKGYGGTTK